MSSSSKDAPYDSSSLASRSTTRDGSEASGGSSNNRRLSSFESTSATGPSFTAEDEAREAAALSPFERIEAECDLRGISPDEAAAICFTGNVNLGKSMSCQSEQEVQQQDDMMRQSLINGVTAKRRKHNVTHVEDASVEELLRQLDRELRSIPDGEKAPYQQAIERRCPDAVGTGGRSRRIAMLRYCDNDPRLAAKRLVEYWEERLRAFGEPRCYLPMALHGIMRDEVASMLERSSHHVLPGHDRAGRNVLVFDLSSALMDTVVRREKSQLWYMLECLQDYHSSGPSGGTVFIINCQGAPEASFLPLAALNQALLMLDVFPIALRAIHYIYPSAYVLREVLPVIKLDIGKELRQRLVVHIEDSTNDGNGNGNEGVLESLASYGLPRATMKDAIGGQHPDRKAWVHQRLAHEYALANQEPVDQGGIGLVAYPNSQPSSSVGLSDSSSPAAEDVNNDVALALEIIEETGTRSGRSGDKRMSRAIKAKIRAPGISAYDALTAGGFVFPAEQRGTRAANVYDRDNVSLQQRKNQLSRRLRQVRDRVAVVGSDKGEFGFELKDVEMEVSSI